MAYLAAPFRTSGEFPVDERLVFKTMSGMISFGKTKSSCMPESYFCVCNETHKFYTYRKDKCSGTSGGWNEVEGSGQAELTKDLLVTTSWGNIKAGTILEEGLNFEDIFTSALNSEVDPKISISYSPTPKKVYYYPEICTITGISMNVTAGTSPISSYELNGTSGLLDLNTFNQTATVSTTADITATSGFTITAKINETTASESSTVVTAKDNVTFCYPYFWGVSETLDQITFNNTTQKDKTKGSYIVNYSGKGYFWYAYPKSYGDLTDIKDTSGAGDTLMSDFNLSSTTYLEQNYNVYYSINYLSVDNDIKFIL